MAANLNLIPLSVYDNFPTCWLKQSISEREFTRPSEGAAFPGEISLLTTEEKEFLVKEIFNRMNISIQKDSLTARIRRTRPGDFSRSFIHHDLGNVAGVIYLSKLPKEEDPCEFGTTFYEHIETGWSSFPDSPKAALLASFIVNSETAQLAKWKVVEKISYEQNRMLIYSGKSFHSGPKCQIGGTCSTERVTLDFFGNLKQ